jgi:translation initiation factor 2A
MFDAVVVSFGTIHEDASFAALLKAKTTMTDQPRPPPPCRVLVRTKRDLELYSLASSPADGSSCSAVDVKKLLEGCATTLLVTARDGKFALVHIASHGVVKLDLEAEKPVVLVAASSTTPTIPPPVFLANSAGVQMMHLSPRGNFVLTWERFNAETCPRNLKVWDTGTGQFLTGFPQKNLSRDAWPYLQWTVDEQYCFLLASTQIRVYSKTDIVSSSKNNATSTTTTTPEPRYIDRLQIEGSNMSVPQEDSSSPSPSLNNGSGTSSCCYLTVFAAKSNNKPATVSIYEYGGVNSSFRLQASKSLFQAEECVTHWSPRANACLLSLQTAVDSSGQSYYGNSLLFLWNGSVAAAENKGEVIAVPLPQEGPVQAVAWTIKSPVSFLAIAGRMPAMASLHHGITGAVTFLFGNNVHRNTIAMSPHGRFVCLAGFGNLAGGMGFWDVHKKKLLPHHPDNAAGTLRAESTVTSHGWAPDSRHFLVASTAPRMNVDNGVHL